MTSSVAENSVLFGGPVKPEAPTQAIERVWTTDGVHASQRALLTPLFCLKTPFERKAKRPRLCGLSHAALELAGLREIVNDG